MGLFFFSLFFANFLLHLMIFQHFTACFTLKNHQILHMPKNWEKLKTNLVQLVLKTYFSSALPTPEILARVFLHPVKMKYFFVFQNFIFTCTFFPFSDRPNLVLFQTNPVNPCNYSFIQIPLLKDEINTFLIAAHRQTQWTELSCFSPFRKYNGQFCICLDL